ncbi:hypothetical protein Mgra_00006782 [Meloidogyne graminicola]|uniref:Uncharacterized protein n=1 Tax=Meloidogyne graminicola TaxID=189291 RepID=A0A8S9ZKA9_9BILA|nr:hypothetical protein Mgra_00006782 [Meloidogyne graminicola]
MAVVILTICAVGSYSEAEEYLELFRNYNIPIDYITLGIFLWNCKFYLVSVSALITLRFIKILPEWLVWPFLALVSIWDLVKLVWVILSSTVFWLVKQVVMEIGMLQLLVMFLFLWLKVYSITIIFLRDLLSLLCF